MQVAIAATPTRWRERAMPVLCGCAMVGAAAVVALNDPSAPGSHFPSCLFHTTTGLWCPGCGLTRGFHQLLNGHPMSAIGYNIFVPLVLVAVVASWWGWLRTAWGRPLQRAWSPAIRRTASTVLPVVLVVYAVLRNIPLAPFRTLAP